MNVKEKSIESTIQKKKLQKSYAIVGLIAFLSDVQIANSAGWTVDVCQRREISYEIEQF